MQPINVLSLFDGKYEIPYTEGVAKTHRFHAIGNGWTVKVIEHILSFAKF